MIRKTLMAATLLLAGCATTQPEPLPGVHTVVDYVILDPVDAARVEALALIAAAGAEGVFEDATTDVTPAVRHVQSGFLCHFTPGEPINAVTVYPPMGGLERGENVGCNTRARGMLISLYATRYGGRLSPEQDVAEAAQAIRNRWPGATPYEDGFPLMSAGDEADPPLHAAFKLNGEEGFYLTYVLIRHHGPWGFKLRASAPDQDVGGRGMVGGMMFVNALSEARRGEPRP